MDSKSQKPRQRVSISDQKIFARILKIDYKVKPKHQHKGEKVLEITRLSGKFPYNLESLRRGWKVSGQSGNFPTVSKFPCQIQNVAPKIKKKWHQKLIKWHQFNVCLSATNTAQYSPVQPRQPRTAHYIPVQPGTAQCSQVQPSIA